MAIYNTMRIPQRTRGRALPTDNNAGYETYVPGSRGTTPLSDAAGRLAGQGAEAQVRALGSLAKGIRALGDTAEVWHATLQREDLARAQDAFAKYQSEMLMRREQLSQQLGGDAIGADGKSLDVRTAMRQFDQQQRAAWMRQVKLGPAGRRYFDQHAEAFGMEQARWADRHYNTQWREYRGQELQTAIATEGRAIAADPFDAETVQARMGRLRALTEQLGDHNGWSPETTAEAFRGAQSKILGEAIAAQTAADNFDGARRLLDQYQGVLDPATATALRERAGARAMQLMRTRLDNGDLAGAERVAGVASGGARTVRGLPANIAAMVATEARRQGVDPVLAQAVAMQESGGNQGVISRAGAIGVMQLMPGTARGLGGDPANLNQNIEMGVRLLKKHLRDAGGNVEEALLRYNWGPGNVLAWKRTGRGASGQEMPLEAREYAARVLGRIGGQSLWSGQQGEAARAALRTARGIERAWRDFEADPAAGAEKLETEAGSRAYGLTRDEGARVAQRMWALNSHRMSRQRQAHSEARRAELDAIDEALAVGDRVRALSLVQEAQHLTPGERARLQNNAMQGQRLGSDADPVYMADMCERVMRGEELNEEELKTQRKAGYINKAGAEMLQTLHEARNDAGRGMQFRKLVEALGSQMVTAYPSISRSVDGKTAQVRALGALCGIYREAGAAGKLGQLFEQQDDVVRMIVGACRPTTREQARQLADEARREYEGKQARADSGIASAVAVQDPGAAIDAANSGKGADNGQQTATLATQAAAPAPAPETGAAAPSAPRAVQQTLPNIGVTAAEARGEMERMPDDADARAVKRAARKGRKQKPEQMPWTDRVGNKVLRERTNRERKRRQTK